MSLIFEQSQTKAQRSLTPEAFGPTNSFQLINGRLVSIVDNPKNYIDKGYSINDIVYSIVTLIMDKIRIAPWGLYTIKDESAMKAYQAMQQRKNWGAKDAMVIRELRHKAIEPVKDPGKVGELLKYPNPEETMQDFVANGCGYKLLVGNKYVRADLLGGGANKGIPQSLRNLPAQWVEIEATNVFPSQAIRYLMSIYENIKYEATEVLHEKYWNPNWNINGQQLYGIAPLKAALIILNRDNSSLKSSTARLANNGIDGILHMRGVPGQHDGEQLQQEVARLKKTMVTEWVGETNAGKMGLSGYDMGWIPLGISAKDLEQIENEKWNLRRLCNVWGVQSQLLNDPDNKTYANQEEAERALTTRCAIPALTAFRDNLNRKFQTDWGLKGKGQIIDFDSSVYVELQKDTGEMVTWLDKLISRGLPMNRALSLLNLENIPDARFDEPWISQSMGQPLSEWDINEMEQTLIDES